MTGEKSKYADVLLEKRSRRDESSLKTRNSVSVQKKARNLSESISAGLKMIMRGTGVRNNYDDVVS